MTTYVLGAGASYHAGYPLAADLGTKLRHWISANIPEGNFWRACIEELHQVYCGLDDLESILTELEECPPGSRAATLTGNVRASVKVCIPEFFNGLREQPALLYDKLACQRIQPGDVVITFNYDLACERSLKNEGLWEISDGYGFRIPLHNVPPSRVKVLKLHGSTNWYGPLFGGMRGFFQMGPQALPSRPAIVFPQDFQFLSYPKELYDPLSVRDSRPAILPALITLARRKRFYVETSLGTREWEEFWNDLWVQARNALQDSERIVIIGYSMPAADEAARSLLLSASNKDASIAIYSGQGSAAIRNEFLSQGFARVEPHGANRFEDFLAS